MTDSATPKNHQTDEELLRACHLSGQMSAAQSVGTFSRAAIEYVPPVEVILPLEFRAEQPAPTQGQGGGANEPQEREGMPLPKPGIKVLAWVEGNDAPICAMWVPKFYLEDSGTHDDFGEYNEADDTYYWPEGWYESNRYEETNWLVQAPVDEWKPLPVRADRAARATEAMEPRWPQIERQIVAAYSAGSSDVDFDLLAARKALEAPPAAQPDPWHEAVLNECMRLESCYDKNDPVKTLRAIINWHCENTKDHSPESLGFVPAAQQPWSEKDARRWTHLCNYMLGPREDLDDALVACETLDQMAVVIDLDIASKGNATKEQAGRLVDGCTESNCRRCTTHPDHRGDMRHAGLTGITKEQHNE